MYGRDKRHLCYMGGMIALDSKLLPMNHFSLPLFFNIYLVLRKNKVIFNSHELYFLSTRHSGAPLLS